MHRTQELLSARILSLYALREHAGPFAFALVVFTFIMLMNQVARQFQNLAGKGLGAEVIVQIFALSIPLTVAVTIPMAVLVATMAAFGRLSGDNEITAMRANGIGLHQIIAPTLVAAVGVAALAVWFNDTVLPESNHHLSQLMQDIQRTKPTVVLEEKRFNDPTGLGEFWIEPQRLNRGTDMMYGLRIFDMSDLQNQRTILADSGRMDYTTNQEDAVLTLWHGTIHQRDISTPGEYEILDFQNQQLLLRGVGSTLERNQEVSAMRSDREMDLGTLLANVRNEEERIANARQELQRNVADHLSILLGDSLSNVAPDSVRAAALGPREPLEQERYRRSLVERLSQAIDYSQRQRNKFLVEYHKKFAIPVACIVFVLIGAPVGVRSRRGGFGFAMGVSTLVFVFYYLFLTGGEDLADRRLLPAWLSMWMANFVFLVIGLVLLRATTKETGGRRWKIFRRLPWRPDDEPTPLEAGLEGRGQRVGVGG